MKDSLLKKYAGKPLIMRNYKSDKLEIFADDIKDFDALGYHIEQLQTGESSLTDDGVSFLEEYYGLYDMTAQWLKECNVQFDREKLKSAVAIMIHQGIKDVPRWDDFDQFVLKFEQQAAPFVQAMALKDDQKEYSNIDTYFRRAWHTFLDLHHTGSNEALLQHVASLMKPLLTSKNSELRVMAKYLFFDDLEEECSKDTNLKQYLSR